MAFGSVRQTLLVYSGVPLAVTGGIVVLWRLLSSARVISSTFLTQLLLPVLYDLVEQRRSREAAVETAPDLLRVDDSWFLFSSAPR